MSTLGGHVGLTFRQALFSPGFQSDGGLLLPETIPNVSAEKLERWSHLHYVDLVCEIAAMFISEEEIPRTCLNKLIHEALSTFTHTDILPVRRFSDGINVLEMFHGKTWAFKDLALSCVGRLIEYFMENDKSHVTIVVGTSGDTGSAVLEAVCGLSSVDCIVLLPHNWCTKIQELQMTTVVADNVHVYRVEGSSDDLDEPIMECFLDSSFAEKHHLCSVNSINWARIMVQIAHHFYAYFSVCEKVGQPVEIVIPTGAMGNLSAGIMAYRMGLPVHYVTAVNTRNDVVDHMIKSGDVIIQPSATTLCTAMDISNPYNVQRIVSLFGDGDVESLKKLLNDINSAKKGTIKEEVLEKIRAVVSSYRGDDDTIRRTMRRCYQDNQYVLCPHSALAVAYQYEQIDKGDQRPRICLATASPLKFPDAVTSADVPAPVSEDVRALFTKPTRFETMEKGQDWAAILRRKIEEISEKHQQ